MDQLGASLGLPEKNLSKNREVYSVGLEALEIAHEAGVKLGWGTDLIGESQDRQNREFLIRAEVESAADILRSMYVVNPGLCHLQGEIGTISQGAIADLVVSRVNPLEDIAALANPMQTIHAVFQSGNLVVER